MPSNSMVARFMRILAPNDQSNVFPPKEGITFGFLLCAGLARLLAGALRERADSRPTREAYDERWCESNE